MQLSQSFSATLAAPSPVQSANHLQARSTAPVPIQYLSHSNPEFALDTGKPPSRFVMAAMGLPDPRDHVAPPSIMQIKIVQLLSAQKETADTTDKETTVDVDQDLETDVEKSPEPDFEFNRSNSPEQRYIEALSQTAKPAEGDAAPEQVTLPPTKQPSFS